MNSGTESKAAIFSSIGTGCGSGTCVGAAIFSKWDSNLAVVWD